MIPFDSSAGPLAAASVRGACWLVEWNFGTGVVRSTSFVSDIPALGQTWIRAGNALSISPISESSDVRPTRVEISISIADAASLAWAIGDPAVYRGKIVRIYLQLLTEDFKPWGDPVRRFTGQMDSVTIERPQARLGDQLPPAGIIKVACSRAGLTRSRRSDGLRLTDAQQQDRYPGDTGYKYVAGLIEKPALWLSRRFQEEQ